jgi:hypothetical protein
MDDPATPARTAKTPRQDAIRAGAPSWRGLVVVVAAVLAVLAAPVVLTRLLTPGEPGWSSNGITLNTSSWEPTDATSGALIVSFVRIDANGCVFLSSPGSVRNVIWPTGYTASRQPDGTVTIANPDGVAVAATGHRLRASGIEAPSDIDLACRVQDLYSSTLMVQDELPPLNW